MDEWCDNTLYSRLNDKNKGAIVIVMQRLHEDDLVGHVLKQEGWEVLSLPAIAEVDERFVVTSPFGERQYSRRVGEALHPDRESLATLDQIRRTLGEYNFAGQYQQTPAPAGGGMVREAWFPRYRPVELPANFDQKIQSWDTANKPSDLADYSVCTTWGVNGPNFYLLNRAEWQSHLQRSPQNTRTGSSQPSASSSRPSAPEPHERRRAPPRRGLGYTRWRRWRGRPMGLVAER